MNSTTPYKSKINIIEKHVPGDRPTEAVAQLRDIAEWLRDDGHRDLAGDLDEQADYIVERYGF